MASETSDVGLDAQDQAETFDETNLDDDAEFVTLEEMPDVYDATRALGDSRDVEAVDADELDADSLDDDDLEDDEDLDDELLDDLEDDEEDDDLDDNDDDGADRVDPDEVEVVAVADVDAETDADDEDESDYESEDLSDDDLEDLGYRGEKAGGGEDKPASGHPDDVPDEAHPHQDELLDEGVEETFPASDPVSVKRIT